MRPNFRLLLSLAGLLLACAGARAEVGHRVYDGALGTWPSQQGLMFLSTPISHPLSKQTLTPGGVVLESQLKEKAGYFPAAQGLVLNSSEGFAMELDFELVTESHVTEHRAGLSLIVLASDLRGLELALWEDSIWVQADSPLFQHAEGASMALAGGGLRKLRVQVLGDSYSVWVEGAKVLEGPLRNYSLFGSPYDLPNFYFIGDDTTSAQSKVVITRVELFTEH